MTLFRRMSDILAANLNDLADRLEDPGKMLRQAVREMDDTIEAATVAAARLIASEKLLEKQIVSARADAGRWQRTAEAAVAAGDDKRARRALSRRRQQEQLIELVEEQLAAARDASVRWRRRIDAMRRKRADAGRMLIELAATESVLQLNPTHGAQAFRSVASPAFHRFGRLRQRAEQALAEAEAAFEIAAEDDWLTAGDEVESEAIEVELLRLKQR
jgi:phage shock protein A